MAIEEIEPRALAERLRGGEKIRLIDVRQAWENELSALAGSELVPLDQLAYGGADVEQEGGEPVVVYCHHGVRSLRGAFVLMQAGFEHVASLAGGIEAWSQTVDPAVPRY
jgi:rhodanese-related sulfurtransferase